jgi:alkylglycerol monooxygenase
LDTTAYYAIGIPLYVAVFALEAVVARWRGRGLPSTSNSVSNISSGLGAIVVSLVVGPILVLLYDVTYRHFALIEWPARSWVPWIGAIVLGDLGNYWRHRLEHRSAMFWAVHGVHHQPEEMNLTVGMRHAWLSDTYAAPFYFALPLLGIPTAHFFIAMAVLTLYALITHSREYNYPSFGILVTPRLHLVHHAVNPRYVDKNYAAMFCVWDRLFGTYADLDPAEPPVLGTERGYETHDGALAQLVLWRDLARVVDRTRTAGGKLRALFGPPPRTAPVAPPPRSAALGSRTKLYVIAQLGILIAFSAHVFGGLRDQPLSALAGSLVIVASIVALGGLLDMRRGAWRWETARCAALVACVAVFVTGAA